MSARIQNIAGVPVTLPGPTYQGILRAGASIVVPGEPSTVIDDLGGVVAVAGVLAVSAAPDGSPVDARFLAAALLSQTPGTTHAYVDGGSGNDGNTGLSPAQALLTIQAVYRKFPWQMMNGARLIVHLAGVGGFDADATATRTYVCRSLHLGGGEFQTSYRFDGPRMVPFAPATGTSAPALAGVPTTLVNQTDVPTATGQRTRLTFTAPGWTANDFRDRLAFCRVTRGGNLVIYECPIADNGVDRLWLDQPIPVGTILATDTVTIVQPGAAIIGDAGGQNFDAVTVFGNAGPILPIGEPYTFVRIMFSGSLCVSNVMGLALDRCALAAGNLSGQIFSGGSVVFVGVKSLGVFSYSTQSGGTFLLPVPDSPASPIPANLGMFVSLMHAGGAVLVGTLQGGVAKAQWAAGANVSVYGAPFGQVGLEVEGAARLSADNAFGTFAVRASLQGDGNTGVGLRARYGAQVHTRGGDFITITGAGGALFCDFAPAVPYGAGAGAFQEVAGFNGNLHRAGGSTATVPLGGFSRIFTAL